MKSIEVSLLFGKIHRIHAGISKSCQVSQLILFDQTICGVTIWKKRKMIMLKIQDNSVIIFLLMIRNISHN